MKTINLSEKLQVIKEHWDPHILAELNGQYVKLAKIQGEFVWHSHEHEDELFFVVKGKLDMHFRDRIEVVEENEMIVIPRGVEHKPVANEETHILLFEPIGTVNTGNVSNEMTKDTLTHF